MKEGTKLCKCKKCGHTQKVSEYRDRIWWMCCVCHKNHKID